MIKYVRGRPGMPLALVMLLVAGLALAGCGGGGHTTRTGSNGSPSAASSATASASLVSDETGKDIPTSTPELTCGQLANSDFSRVAGARTTISSTTTVAKSASNSFAYCDVKGVTSGSVDFELLLPTTTFAGRYVQEGCEGLCGMTDASAEPSVSTGCAHVTGGSFAIGEDDEGHTSGGLGGTVEKWARTGRGREEFGYLSEHQFSIAAKAIITRFYGSAPDYSYYDGCSDGGREALMEAQRYPRDFNGIIAGAPAFNQTALNGIEEAYMDTIDFRADGSVILPASKLPMLHKAVEKQCADPKLHDDTIQDPHSCTFDPASIRCSGTTDRANCLTAAQVAVVRKAYAGAVAPDATHLYTGGEPYGSELIWAGLFIPDAGQGQASTEYNGIALSFLRWLAYAKPHPGLKLSASLFTVANFKRMERTDARTYDATNPNLTAFYRAGGKLIMWQGLADQNIPPAGTLAYRSAVITAMGAATVKKFYRLYMFPGVYHCGDGTGPSTFDLLSPLIAWTETGKAPDAIVASKTSGSSSFSGTSGGQISRGSGGTGGASSGGTLGSGPSGSKKFRGPGGKSGFGGPGGKPGVGGGSGGKLGSGPSGGGSSSGSGSTSKVLYTRPIYPYPELVAYTGHGSTKDASNYEPYTPKAMSDAYTWAGSFPTYR